MLAQPAAERTVATIVHDSSVVPIASVNQRHERKNAPMPITISQTTSSQRDDCRGALIRGHRHGRRIRQFDTAWVSAPNGADSARSARVRRNRSSTHEVGSVPEAICSKRNLSAHATMGRNSSWSYTTITASIKPSCAPIGAKPNTDRNGLATNAAGSNHTQALELAGGRNVAAVDRISGESTNAVALEQLYVWKPDLILVWTPNADRLVTYKAIVEDPNWQRLSAVREGRVLQIPWLPFSWFDRPPGSNRLLGVLWLAETLYPEWQHFDLGAATQAYFRLFYHHEISAAEAQRLFATARPAAGAKPAGAR